jgi:hypothetical protein
MRSPFYFITKPLNNKRYDNTRDIDGAELVISVSDEDHKFSNRYAEVISTPLWYKGDISEGDILLVHHNVFKYYYDMKGKQRSGRSFFKDDIFLIDSEQFFAYKKDDKWYSYDRYCLVKPHPKVESYLYKGFSDEPLMGIMGVPNNYLQSKGISSGDAVIFTPDSEYEFNVDGEIMYRIFDHQIVARA